MAGFDVITSRGGMLFMWRGGVGGLPEDPSCLACLASLELLAVPAESKHSVSAACWHIRSDQRKRSAAAQFWLAMKIFVCVNAWSKINDKRVASFHFEVIPCQSAESSALSSRKFWGSGVPGNHRNARNNRSFPAPLSGAVFCFFFISLALIHSLLIPQNEAETREKTEGPQWPWC